MGQKKAINELSSIRITKTVHTETGLETTHGEKVKKQGDSTTHLETTYVEETGKNLDNLLTFG